MQDTSGQALEARDPLPPPIVPIKYTSLMATDLTADVKDEENTVNFDLVDSKKR